jgi:deazaflavin-dependent oxidoreductase (nitroreductase family)
MSELSPNDHYRPPGWFTKHIFNGLISGLTKTGISVWGSRTLNVRGRTSGEWRSNPVNVLTFEGQHYLVAARGQTQWVRNLRVGLAGELKLGRRVQPFTASELPDDEKIAVIRSYLKRWKMEVGVFFDGVTASSSDEEVARIAPNHPVFKITYS